MQASGPGPINRDEIEAEAARLLAKLNNQSTPQDEAEVCAWLEANPHHAVAFARAEAAWEAAERLKSAAAEVNLPPMAQIVSEEQQRRLSRNIMAVAAIAILLFIVAAIVTVQTFSGVDRYETQVGEVRKVRLDDGSILHLNSDSEAEVRLTDNGRKVRIMRGEASFDVAHDTARPFDVEARSAVFRASDTTFNVRMRPSLIELTVLKGNVRVRCGGGGSQMVDEGYGVVLQPRSFVVTRLDRQLLEQRTAWRGKMVKLAGETVEQAASEFNRYRAAPILIGDTRVSGLRIDGSFHIADSARFLSALSMSLPVRIIDGEDGSVMLLYRDQPGRIVQGGGI